MKFSMFLLLISGIAWTVVYLDAIRIGFKEKSYGIPFWALALNIAWEFTHTITGYVEIGFFAQVIVNAVWMLLDIGILITYFRYGYAEFPKRFSKSIFYIWSVFVILLSFLLQYIYIREFGLVFGASYAAFIQNLIMSFLFLAMLLQRGSSKGQTILIAFFKMIGTLSATVLFGCIGHSIINGPNFFMLILGVIILCVDLIYLILLVLTKQNEKIKASD